MADHDQRALVLVEPVFEYFEGLDVQVVGRLVEDQEIRRPGEQPGEDDPVAFAARQGLYRGHGAFGREQEALEIADHVALVTVDAHVVGAVADDVGHAFFRVEVFAQLAEIADLQRRALRDRAVLRLDFAEQDAQQGALAHAVVADQANAVAAADLAGKVIE